MATYMELRLRLIENSTISIQTDVQWMRARMELLEE
jgi:hypothetical protein